MWSKKDFEFREFYFCVKIMGLGRNVVFFLFGFDGVFLGALFLEGRVVLCEE